MSKYVKGTKVKVEFYNSFFKYGTVLNSVDSPYINEDFKRINILLDNGVTIELCHRECVFEIIHSYSVTGTVHGSIVEAKSEVEARRIFHKHYNGESIIHICKRKINNL